MLLIHHYQYLLDILIVYIDFFHLHSVQFMYAKGEPGCALTNILDIDCLPNLRFMQLPAAFFSG